MSEDHVIRLWQEASDLPPTLEKVSKLEHVANLADQAGMEEVGFDVRGDLMEAAVFSGASATLLTAFSWCLGKSDEDPERFPEEDLLWNYKWAISNAVRFPQVSLKQLNEMLDDFEMRLGRNGLSLRPAAYLRMSMHAEIGELEEAERYARRWPTLPRDMLADCPACEMDTQIDVFALLNRHEEALRGGRQILDEEMFCAEVPHRTYATLTLSAMQQDQLEQADDFYQVGFPMVQGNPDFLPQIGKYLLYLAKMGEQRTGLEAIERHFDWALRTLEAADQWDFYVGALALLRTVEQPQVSLRLPDQHPLRQPETPDSADADALRQWLQDELDRITNDFNRRNQNQWQTQSLNALLQIAKPA